MGWRREGREWEGRGRRGGKGRGVPPLLSLHFKHWLEVNWIQSLHLDSGKGLHFTMMMLMMLSACELVLELIKYDDKDEMLRGLVQLLTPSNDEVERAKANISQGILCSVHRGQHWPTKHCLRTVFHQNRRH